MPRRKKPHIEVDMYESTRKKAVAYDIYFPGSQQRIVVLAEGLNHWEVKKLLFEATKASPTLLGLDGKVVKAGGRPFRFRAGRYKPIEGECRPEECPNFWAMAFELTEEMEVNLCGALLEIQFQRNQTGTKAVALAVAVAGGRKNGGRKPGAS